MDTSRRSFDRSREPALKKPRLATDEPRQFSNRSIGSGLTQAQSRLDGDDPSGGGGGGYQPQPLPPHQQHRELLEQYRTALSELTFNCKPIITNLTIIAGENQHAAKAIASAICANILEVPSDQKLPSLYLLDSIVKNIGRDYIKHFAVKLPEVFCKAYKQVEPPVHSSMRHLFGTWKGVFHPQVLQIIEKELGFGSSANGSSATATSRSESQTQRPPHSIHVNPKYLERQRLQQSATPKGTTSDMDKSRLNSSEDIERLERPTGITGVRPWKVPSAKMQRSQRDPRIVPLQNKRNTGVVYGDLEYGPEISRNSGLGPGRGGIKATEQKPWYGDDDGSIDDTVPKQRNGFPAKNKLQGYPPPKFYSIDSQLTRTGGGMSTSWKNSEEEEFSWDSMDSRLTDRDAAINTANIPRKDEWITDGSEKLDFENNFPKTFSSVEQNHAGLLGTPSHVVHSDECPGTVSRLPTSGNSLSRIGAGLQVRSSSSGTSGQQRIRSLGLQSPSAQSPIRPHSPPIDLARHSQGDAKTAKFSIDSSLGLTSRYGDNSFSSLSSVWRGDLKRPQPYESKEASPPVAPFQPRQLPHISQQVSAQVSGRPSTIRDSSQENSTPISTTARQLSASTSSLLAALAKTGGISAMIPSMPRLSSQDDGIQASQVNLEALPSDPQSSELPIPMANSGSLPGLATPHGTAAAADFSPGTKTKNEPEGSPKVAVAKKSSDPISSLLSSLVAKGLISAAKTESAAPVSSHSAKLLPNEEESIIASSEPITSASFSAKVAVSTTAEGLSTPEPVAETSSLSRPPAVTEEIKNLLGFEFRPEVIRKFHSIVIDDLFDNFPHQCGICGLRLKLKEQLDRHLVSHASLNSEQKDAADVAHRWYAHSSDWIAGRTGSSMDEAESMEVEEKCIEAGGIPEPMVPADESQCACVLCGELFEDFYDLGKDEWMFKEAVYMNIPCGIPEFSTEIDGRGLVVHANCLSGNSLEDLGLHFHVKKEDDA